MTALRLNDLGERQATLVDLGTADHPAPVLGHHPDRPCTCTWSVGACLQAKGRPFRTLPIAPGGVRWVAYCCCQACDLAGEQLALDL